MRKVILFLLFLLPFAVSATIRTGIGEWRADGNAKELYATSLGRLYQLQPNEGDGSYIGCSPAHENYAACSCDVCRKGRIRITSVLSLKMPKKIKITTKTRYIAFDFRIRVFPALEKDRFSQLRFSLLDSVSPISGSMHFDLHGRKLIRENIQDNFYYSHQAPFVTGGHGRSFIHPAFEPLSLRVVYDLMGKKMTYFMNGREFEYPMKIHGKMASLRLRYFGIVTYEKNHVTHEKLLRKRYFEVSPPKVYIYDDGDELPPPPPFSAYPYNGYMLENLLKNSRSEKVSTRPDREEFRKVLRHKNPDLQYAYALRYLYGNTNGADPEKGVELLEHAARKHHALALHQLGICFWRGYGGRPDLNKAAKYFAQAVDLGHPEAAAARLQMEMELHGRPWFLTEQYQKYLKQFPEGTKGHDEHYFQYKAEFLSPKRLWGHLSVSKMVRIDDPKLNYLDYRLRANDPFSFLAQAFFLHVLRKDRFFKQGERYLERALNVKHFEAYPFWLLSQLYRNRLPEKEKIPLEMRLLHADDPLFNFVYALVCLPETERMKYLRSEDSELRLRPQKEWKMNTPESGYLRAMGKSMWNFFPEQCLFGLLLNDTDHKLRREIFELIKRSSEAKYAPALYLMGKFYYYADLPEPDRSQYAVGTDFRQSTAERFLIDAAKQGHVPSALLLCKVKLYSPFPKCEEILPVLEKLCAMEIPEAFYLKAETLLKMNRKPEALAAADAAVKSGEHRGLLFLSRHDDRVNADVRRERLVQFIRADRAKRRMDPYDPYWDEPYGEYLKWVSPQTLKVEEKESEQPFGPSVSGRKVTSSGITEKISSKSESKKTKTKTKTKTRTKSKIRYRDE